MLGRRGEEGGIPSHHTAKNVVNVPTNHTLHHWLEVVDFVNVDTLSDQPEAEETHEGSQGLESSQQAAKVPGAGETPTTAKVSGTPATGGNTFPVSE